jgi:hypothetical protein
MVATKEVVCPVSGTSVGSKSSMRRALGSTRTSSQCCAPRPPFLVPYLLLLRHPSGVCALGTRLGVDADGDEEDVGGQHVPELAAPAATARALPRPAARREHGWGRGARTWRVRRRSRARVSSGSWRRRTDRPPGSASQRRPSAPSATPEVQQSVWRLAGAITTRRRPSGPCPPRLPPQRAAGPCGVWGGGDAPGGGCAWRRGPRASAGPRFSAAIAPLQL